MIKRARPGQPRKDSSRGDFKDTWGDLSGLAEQSVAPRFSSIPPSQQRASASIKDLRLLLVDDEPARLDAFAMELRELGAQVAVGDRGELGYAQAVRLVPDVIISDLVKPGEPGWRLVQKLRRHPLLRWSPVLLLRWWQKRSDERVAILTDHVVERLKETMAPHRSVADRIRSTIPFSERLDSIGPPALMRLLADSKAAGTLTLNDAWSVFEVGFTSGRIHSVVRRGLGGGVDFGPDAFLQFMLSDTGRWTLRKKRVPTGPRNLDDDLDLSLERAAHVLGGLFGFDGVSELRRPERLKVDVESLTEAASTHSVMALRVANALKGTSRSIEIERLLKNDPDELCGVIMNFFSCGALRLRRKDSKDAPDEALRGLTEGVSLLLEGLAQARRVPGGDEKFGEPGPARVPPAPALGKTRTRKSSMGGPHSRGNEARPFVPLSAPAASGDSIEPMRASSPDFKVHIASRGDSMRGRGDLEEMHEPTRTGPRKGSARSTIPDKEPSNMGAPRVVRNGPAMNRFSMWLAIGLSLVLGAMILFGLVLIASGDKKPGADAGDAAAPARAQPEEEPRKEPIDKGRLYPSGEVK